MDPCSNPGINIVTRAFAVNIVAYKLFPVRKITGKPIQASIFYSIVWKLPQEDFVIYSVRSIEMPSV